MDLCAFHYPELDVLLPVKKTKNPDAKRKKDSGTKGNLRKPPNKSKFPRKCP